MGREDAHMKLLRQIFSITDQVSCLRVIRNGFKAAVIYSGIICAAFIARIYFEGTPPGKHFLDYFSDPMLLDPIRCSVLGFLILLKSRVAASLLVISTFMIMIFYPDMAFSGFGLPWYLAATRGTFLWHSKHHKTSVDEISIELAKADYTGGGIVEGALTFSLTEPTEARGVYVHISGWEESYWETGEAKYRQRHHEIRDLFNHELTLFGHPNLGDHEHLRETINHVLNKNEHRYEVIPPGIHKYPFSYTLPPGLPGSFEDPDKSRIRYQIKGYVDMPRKDDLACTHVLDIYQTYDAESVCSASTEKVFQLNDSDLIEMKALLDRNVFFPGESVTGMYSIMNYSDKEDFSVTMELKRVIELKAEDQNTRIFSPLHPEEKVEASIPRGQLKEIPINIRLPEDLDVGVTGELVRVVYELMFRLKISWREHLDFIVPVTIIKKRSSDQMKW